VFSIVGKKGLARAAEETRLPKQRAKAEGKGEELVGWSGRNEKRKKHSVNSNIFISLGGGQCTSANYRRTPPDCRCSRMIYTLFANS